jgi:hypothetical protein
MPSMMVRMCGAEANMFPFCSHEGNGSQHANSKGAGVAALTVTAARERMVEFTQPFYSTGLDVAVPINESPWASITRAFLSFGFFKGRPFAPGYLHRTIRLLLPPA